MIVNERQYKASRKQVKLFERALEDARDSTPRAGLDPKIHAAMVDGIHGELQDLRKQVRRYEQVKAGKVTTRKIKRVADLPEALIEARIARNLTHKQLAEQMGMAEQQIQRYEKERYGKTSLNRLAQIADALGVELGAEVRFAKPASAKAGSVARTQKATSARDARILAAKTSTTKTTSVAAGRDHARKPSKAKASKILVKGKGGSK
jgi:transcriptional regulator with XRE-family HTH domain